MALSVDREASVAVVGDFCTGKTTLCRYLVSGKLLNLDEEEYLTTVSCCAYRSVDRVRISFPYVDLNSGTSFVRFEEFVMGMIVYDTPSSDSFSCLVASFIHHADVALFVASRRRKESLVYVERMLERCACRRKVLVVTFEDEERGENPVTALEVEEEEKSKSVLATVDDIADFTKKWRIEYVEVSAKTGEGMERMRRVVLDEAAMVAKKIERVEKRCGV